MFQRLLQLRRFIHHKQRIRHTVVPQVCIKHLFRSLHLQGYDPQCFRIRQRAFGSDIVKPDTVNIRVKPLNTGRILAVQGEHVDDAAPHRKLPDRIHFIGPFIAHSGQHFNKPPLFQCSAHGNFQAVFSYPGRPGQFLQQRFCRNKYNARLFAGNQTQGRRSPRLDFQVPAVRLYPGQVRGIKLQHRQFRIQISQRLPIFPHRFSSGHQKYQCFRLHGLHQGAQIQGFDGSVQP